MSYRIASIAAVSLFAVAILRAEDKTPPLAISPFDAAKAKQYQEVWAKRLNTNVEITNTIGLKLRLIPAGEFQMGSPDSDKDAVNDEKPQHRVRLTNAFYLGKFEVTRGEFRKFIEATNYQTDAEKDAAGAHGFSIIAGDFEQRAEFTWRQAGFEQTDQHPVVNVSWNDAIAFCKWLSKKEGKSYRLPTEAEWEWACRAGTATRWNCGLKTEDLRESANVADASLKMKIAALKWSAPWNDRFPFTSSVGKFAPNSFGLHDMHGNVWEWCNDWIDDLPDRYYLNSPLNDPHGPKKGHKRVIRGGGWIGYLESSRTANRPGEWPSDGRADSGFRVVREMSEN